MLDDVEGNFSAFLIARAEGKKKVYHERIEFGFSP
jgi:hypothetical protein